MSRLSTTLQQTLNDLSCSARSLEQRAQLPSMTVGNIQKGAHPRSDRFERLLAAIPLPSLRLQLLTAYTADDTPETYTQAVLDILGTHLEPWLRQHRPDLLGPTETEQQQTLAESVTPYTITHKLPTATKARRVLEALTTAVEAGDTQVIDWLAETGPLLTKQRLDPQW